MTAPSAARDTPFGRRYPIPKPGSLEVVELPSVTALLGVIGKPGLENWKRMKLAQALAIRPDLVILASTGDQGAKDAVRQSEDTAASNRGTGLHYWVEQLDNGTIMWEMVPEGAKKALNAYAQAKEDFGWVVELAETTTYSHTVGYAGTADQFTRWPKFSKNVHTTDLKTGKGVYADFGLQMAAYNFADGLWIAGETPEFNAASEQLEKDIKDGVNVPPTPTGRQRTKWTDAAVKAAKAELQESYWEEYAKAGTHLPMPADLDQETAFIIHLSDEHCDVVPLNIGGLKPAVEGLVALHRFLQTKNIVGDPLANPKTPVETLSPHAEPTVATPAQITQTSDLRKDVEPQPPLTSDPNPTTTFGMKLISVEDAKAIVKKAQEDGTAIPETSEAELAGIPELEPATEVPVAPMPSNEQRIAVYRERIAALPVEAKKNLAFRWPNGVPTFKQSTGHTAEQLNLIDEALWAIEGEYTKASAENRALETLGNTFPGSVAA